MKQSVSIFDTHKLEVIPPQQFKYDPVGKQI